MATMSLRSSVLSSIWERLLNVWKKSATLSSQNHLALIQIQEARDNEDVEVEEDVDSFYIMDNSLLDKWYELKIHERLVKQRNLISIQFEYAGETFTDRVYIDQIDLTHYDEVWDWWFGSHNENFPNLNFELTADKDADGNPSIENAYINVYKDDESCDSIETIRKVKLQKTLTERKSNYVER